MSMLSVIHLSILLMISVVSAENRGFLIYSHMKPSMTLSSSNIKRGHHDRNLKTSMYAVPPKWQKNPLFCCTCQDFVKQAKPKIDLKIQLNINKFCSMFNIPVKMKCLEVGRKLKTKIFKKLFPGNTPRETCRHIKLCLY